MECDNERYTFTLHLTKTELSQEQSTVRGYYKISYHTVLSSGTIRIVALSLANLQNGRSYKKSALRHIHEMITARETPLMNALLELQFT